MFIVTMEYYFESNTSYEDRSIFAQTETNTISEAKEAAKKFADTAASRLESCGDEWGYRYPGYIDYENNVLGRVYYLTGGGQCYEIFVEQKAD